MKQTTPYLPGYILPQEGTALAAAVASTVDSPTVETVLKARRLSTGTHHCQIITALLKNQMDDYPNYQGVGQGTKTPTAL